MTKHKHKHKNKNKRKLTLREKIAELDRMNSDESDTVISAPASTINTINTIEDEYAAVSQEFDNAASIPSIPLPSIPVVQDEAPSSPSSPDNAEDDDVIEAMQQLLLKHEDTQLHRVEDPDLERVLKELRNIAHTNIADVFKSEEVMEYIGEDADGAAVHRKVTRLGVRDLDTLPRDITACIQSIKCTSTPRGDVIEVKMYDKLVSLDKLMRFHGAYMRDNEQQSKKSDGIMDLLLASIGSSGLPIITNNEA